MGLKKYEIEHKRHAYEYMKEMTEEIEDYGPITAG